MKHADVHPVLDNYGTHKTAEIKSWLAKHPPRFNLHFTPTRASWLNLVERFLRQDHDQAHEARRIRQHELKAARRESHSKPERWIHRRARGDERDMRSNPAPTPIATPCPILGICFCSQTSTTQPR